jgi:hypothetical protein
MQVQRSIEIKTECLELSTLLIKIGFKGDIDFKKYDISIVFFLTKLESKLERMITIPR